MILEFFIPGKPTGKARARTVTQRFDRKLGRAVPLPFARTYTPEATENYAGLVQFHARKAMAGQGMLEGPLRADFVFLFAVPASWSNKKTASALAGAVRPEVKPDFDNAMKLVTDALNSLAYRDDVSIVEGSFAKRYAEAAGMWVRIRSVFEDVQGGRYVDAGFTLVQPDLVDLAIAASSVEQEPF